MSVRLRCYVGTQRSGPADGIHVASLDADSGIVEEVRQAATLPAPSFLVAHPTRPVLFACSEVRGAEACVVAFRIHADGSLEEINRQPSGGSLPCFVGTDTGGVAVFVAHYGSGSVALFPVRDDGGLMPASACAQHRGVRRARAHCARLDTSGRRLLVTDLGLDQLVVYDCDPLGGTLSPLPSRVVQLADGAGPRHVAIHGSLAVLVEESASRLSAWRWQADGDLQLLAAHSTVPPGTAGSDAAEVVIHPSGHWAFVSNRGHDSIALFGFDPRTGQLRPAGWTPSGGRTPRHIAIDPSGRSLLVANQDSDSVTVFGISPDDGTLTWRAEPARVPAPSCIAFVR